MRKTGIKTNEIKPKKLILGQTYTKFEVAMAT